MCLFEMLMWRVGHANSLRVVRFLIGMVTSSGDLKLTQSFKLSQ